MMGIPARIVTRMDEYREKRAARKVLVAQMAALLGQKVEIEEAVDFIDLDLDLRFSVQVEIYIDCPEKATSAKRSFRVLFLLEPEEISGARSLLQKEKFDLVFGRCKNELLFPHGGTWVPRSMITERHTKPHKGASFICGDKTQTRGHVLRQDLWHTDCPSLSRFLSSRTTKKHLLDHSQVSHFLTLDSAIQAKAKEAIAPYCFHVAIESVCEDSYFTEKLIDCLLLRTIPIYWGCPNLADFFNLDGIIHIPDLATNEATVAAFLQVLHSPQLTDPLLGQEDYDRRSAAIEENYQRALRWIHLDKRMHHVISSALPTASPSHLPPPPPALRREEKED